tara:strand:+ start:783 stop:1490 length:708 start_codon:yes stop_codon:yes gene_type:complete
MNVTALENLKILNEKKSETHSLLADGNVLSLIEKDSFDPISKLQSLEYPIFFTYHHVFNILTHDRSVSYYQKKYLLEQIEESLENLMDFIHDYDEENQLLIEIISDIEEKFDIVREKTIYKKCENMIHLFDDLVDACRLAGKCLYFSPRPYDILYDLEPGEFYDSVDEVSSDSSNEENFDEFEFEGVSYSEDNRFDKIYNQDKKFVGIWNDGRDVIMWLDDECEKEHETSKVKLD